MLLASNFVLNQSDRKEQFELYPFIHNFSNLKREDQAFLKIKVPDICPSKLEFINFLDEAMTRDKEYDFSMVAGEFIEVY